MLVILPDKMTIIDSETGQVIPIIRLVRTQEDLDAVQYDNYDRVVVAVGEGKKSVTGDGVIAMLILGHVNGYQISNRTSKGETFGSSKRPYVDVRRKDLQPQYKGSCEMPRPTRRAMNMDEMADFCAAMPPGVGEEEYCTRVLDYLDKGGDVA